MICSIAKQKLDSTERRTMLGRIHRPLDNGIMMIPTTPSFADEVWTRTSQSRQDSSA
jgi:hypothetical protein